MFNKRGFIREGYYADLVVLKEEKWNVTKKNILYACQWSPFEEKEFNFKIAYTFVNGNKVYDNGTIINKSNGKELDFIV